jgi:hypothetical protein
MAVGEKIDWKKWFMSYLSGVDWIKAANIGIKIVAIVAVVLGVLYGVSTVKHWFEPKKGTVQTQSPNIGKADNVNFIQQKSKNFGLTLGVSKGFRGDSETRVEVGVIYLF